MRTFDAVSRGLSRATSSPRLVVCLWLICLAVALPATLVVRQAVKRSVVDSRAHLDLEQRFDMDWYSEYSHDAVGSERLLTPTSVRPAAFLDNLDAWFSGALFTTDPALVALGVVFAIGWTLLAGGVLHRYVYQETEFSLRQLLGHGAEFFPRFARLLALTAVLYFFVYRFARWLFPRFENAMRDVTVERTALAVHLAGALLIILLLVFVRLISDYAKVATVLQDRRSMLIAAWQAMRFVMKHPLRTFGAYALVAVGGLAALGVLAWLAPGQAQSGLLGVAWAFFFGQVMLAVRLLQRLTIYGTAVEIYRDIGD